MAALACGDGHSAGMTDAYLTTVCMAARASSCPSICATLTAPACSDSAACMTVFSPDTCCSLSLCCREFAKIQKRKNSRPASLPYTVLQNETLQIKWSKASPGANYFLADMAERGQVSVPAEDLHWTLSWGCTNRRYANTGHVVCTVHVSI